MSVFFSVFCRHLPFADGCSLEDARNPLVARRRTWAWRVHCRRGRSPVSRMGYSADWASVDSLVPSSTGVSPPDLCAVSNHLLSRGCVVYVMAHMAEILNFQSFSAMKGHSELRESALPRPFRLRDPGVKIGLPAATSNSSRWRHVTARSRES
jgi:hypothetical protein